MANSLTIHKVHAGYGAVRVIEDVSTDNADTYIIANPGEWSTSERVRHETSRSTSSPVGSIR